MDIYGTADWHARATRPVNRIDDYVSEMYRKIEYIVDHYTNNLNAAALLIGGDVFDSHDTPDHVKERLIRMLGGITEYCEPWIGAVFGQHDQRYHTSEKKNTPLGVVAAGVRNFHILGDLPASRSVSENELPVHIYGSSWNEAVPEPLSDQKVINILVTHRTLSDSAIEWADNSSFTLATDFLKTYPKYHYVISGDNHKAFEINYRMRRVLNCGPLMRSSIDLVDYAPGFFIIHTTERTVERVTIPHEPATKVFDLGKITETKDFDANIEKFVATLKQDAHTSVSFEKNLSDYLETSDIKKSVKDAIGEIMA